MKTSVKFTLKDKKGGETETLEIDLASSDISDIAKLVSRVLESDKKSGDKVPDAGEYTAMMLTDYSLLHVLGAFKNARPGDFRYLLRFISEESPLGADFVKKYGDAVRKKFSGRQRAEDLECFDCGFRCIDEYFNPESGQFELRCRGFDYDMTPDAAGCGDGGALLRMNGQAWHLSPDGTLTIEGREVKKERWQNKAAVGIPKKIHPFFLETIRRSANGEKLLEKFLEKNELLG